MATSLPWYKEVSPTQKKALFAAWLGCKRREYKYHTRIY